MKKEMAREERKKSFRAYVISTVILVAAVVLCAVIAIQILANGYVNIFGYSVFRVVTGSMEPTLPIGTVLLSESVGIDEVSPGEIICFRSREASHYGYIVTHRVISVRTGADGKTYLESRGDANYSSDPYDVDEANLIGRVIWHTGKDGFLNKVLSFITGRIGFFAVIVIPILVIAGIILGSVGKNIKGELNSTLDKISREGKKKPKEDELLPGYSTLTKKDYNDIYETLKREIWKELNVNVEVHEGKTEYSEKDS